MSFSINDLKKDTTTSIFLSVPEMNLPPKTTMNRFYCHSYPCFITTYFCICSINQIHLSYSHMDRPNLNQSFVLILIMLHDFFSANGCKALDRCISVTSLENKNKAYIHIIILVDVLWRSTMIIERIGICTGIDLYLT